MLQQDAQVLARLGTWRFVTVHGTDATPQMQCPQQLLDPGVALLQTLFHNVAGVFPSGEFAERRWLEVLRAAGMQRTLSNHMLLVGHIAPLGLAAAPVLVFVLLCVHLCVH